VKATMAAAFRLTAALLLLQCMIGVVECKKVARVKAGKTYKSHAPVHIVVNKVGYVKECLL
jgi:hypothetical protein